MNKTKQNPLLLTTNSNDGYGLNCDGCYQYASSGLVRVGENPDYDYYSCTARLCRKCITAALALFPKESEESK